jgi:SAM-dependent methyltransferase
MTVSPDLPAAPICTFLALCNDSGLPRDVLDCGAGGPSPPLASFQEHGYATRGVEISIARLEDARRFSACRRIDLGIIPGDMRSLPFSDGSFSFVYSYNSICHMTKREVAQSMAEIVRVLRRGGLCFVNFLSIHDGRFGHGPRVGPGEYGFVDGDDVGLHSFFAEGEPDPFFAGLELVRREATRVERFREGRTTVWGELHYIAQRP